MIIIFTELGHSREIVQPNSPTLEQLYDWLGCRTIDIVNVYWLDESAQMIVDGDGLLRDPPALFNPMGFGFYAAMAMRNRDRDSYAISHPIVGTVVLLTKPHLLD